MKIKDYLTNSTTFEKSKIKLEHDLVDSYKKITIGLFIIVVLLLVILIIILPLKEFVPYVIQVDKSTGNQAVITSLVESNYTPTEAEDKFNIKRYIVAREGYVYDTLQNNYDLVLLLTNKKIIDDFLVKYKGSNSREDMYKDKIIIEPKIISIALKDSNGKSNAIVRVQLTKKDLVEKTIQSKNVLITMSYDYDMSNVMSDIDRLDNPLGFIVDYYRIDDEATND